MGFKTLGQLVEGERQGEMEKEVAVVDGYRQDDVRHTERCLADLSPEVQPDITVIEDATTHTRFLLHESNAPEREAEIEIDTYHVGVTPRALALADGRVFVRDRETRDREYLGIIIPNLVQQAGKYFAGK